MNARLDMTRQPVMREIRFAQQTVAYRLRRSKRRSIGFMINPDGLHVTAPEYASIAAIEAALYEKERWIISKLQVAPARPKVVWADGLQFAYLGQHLVLRLSPDAPRAGQLIEASGELLLRPVSDPARVPDLVRRWLQTRAEVLFAERLHLWASRMGVRFASLGLSSAKTRWGSCSVDGKIRLNWRLMHFALHLIDYVVVHELAHLSEMNHSPRFWARVGQFYPEYAKARAELRQQAQALRHLL